VLKYFASIWRSRASTNGVFLNGLRISTPVVLVAGDVIGIGDVQIAVGSIDD
jgi:pSer/pThr/pTyr-binding forkhead associated (FHA) protein